MNIKSILVTGGAGFIGSNVCEQLIQKGHRVTAIDNLRRGKLSNISQLLQNVNFKFINGDLLDPTFSESNIKDFDCVIHLAANADVKGGVLDTHVDLRYNTILTHNILESMRKNNITNIIFSSTGSVYGEPTIFPTPECAPFPIQTSLYAASKVACEGLISSYCEAFGIQATVFRFVSILGKNYSHGHVIDFFNKLKNDPRNLEILGDGNQRKSYLHVNDCCDAIDKFLNIQSKKSYEVYNLGFDGYISVIESAKHICNALKVKPKFHFTGGKRGWVGDSPFIHLDTKKIKKVGWEAKYDILESINDTVFFLLSK